MNKMPALPKTPNFKAQSSNKAQISKFKTWNLLFDVSLVFGLWSLNFVFGVLYG